MHSNTTQDNFEEFDNNISYINDKNLLSRIWTNPSDTLNYILKNCPDRYVTILLVLGGIVRAITRASNRNMGDNMTTILVLAISIITGGLFGWITYYIYAWALSLTGKWLGGESNPSKFRTVIAWALIPSICSLILLIPELIIFGDDLFKSQTVYKSEFIRYSWIAFGLTELALSIWSITILVIGIGILQKFGIGKSILNMILPLLVLLIPIFAIVLITRV